MSIDYSQFHANIIRAFASVNAGVKHLKDKIAKSHKVQISNIPKELLDKLLPELEGKDVKIILPNGTKPTEEMLEVGDVAIQSEPIYSDFKGVKASEGTIYFSDVVFCVTWAGGKVMQIYTLKYNEHVKWFEMGWRYAEKVK
jgi:hypothetical protein